MALDLNEYIKQSYERPNRKVLEGLGASEDLIEYLMETPGNTNWNVLNGMGGNESGVLLYEADHSFRATPGGYLFSSESTPKEQIYNNLIEGNRVRVSIGTNISTGTITEAKSIDGYEVIKYFNLDAPFTEDCRINWDEYGQNPNAYIYLYLYDEPGTYHVKIEKI